MDTRPAMRGSLKNYVDYRCFQSRRSTSAERESLTLFSIQQVSTNFSEKVMVSFYTS